jgi:hypothetical protein
MAGTDLSRASIHTKIVSLPVFLPTCDIVLFIRYFLLEEDWV